MVKILRGVVISTGMQDTVVVEVFRKKPHPLYKKLLTRSKKFKVDPSGKKLAIGDTVLITETRPLSKGKYFKLTEVVETAKEAKHA